MKIFEMFKKLIGRKKEIKLLKEENQKKVITNREEFKNSIKELKYEKIEITEIESKILQIIGQFRKLFIKMLEEKNVKGINNNYYFSALASQTKEYYPNIAKKIENVLYYYTEEPDSEEKVENMMKLYQAIKEGVNESSNADIGK